MMIVIYSFFKSHGFALELSAAAALFAWHVPRKDYFWLRAAVCVLAQVGVSLLWSMLPLQNVMSQSARYLLMIAVCVGGIRLCHKVEWAKALLITTAAGTAQHLVFKGAGTLEFCTSLIFGPNIWSDSIAYPLFVPLLFALCYLLFGRRLSRAGNSFYNARSLSLLFVSMLTCFGLYQNLLDAFYEPIGWQMYTVFNLLDMTVCVSFLVLIIVMQERGKAEQSSIILQQLLHQQKEQLQTSKEMIDLINIKCHDMKNQIASLGSRISQEEIEDLSRAIAIYDTVARTGNEALDVLLAEKALLCEQQQIQLDYMADGASLAFLKPADIYFLFGNAIDNAMEASVKLKDPEMRYISMKVRTEREMLVIHFENRYAGNLRFDDGLPITTKEDDRYHGFGMKSIRMIVEKYNGYLSVSGQDGLFSLNILLPLPVCQNL